MNANSEGEGLILSAELSGLSDKNYFARTNRDGQTISAYFKYNKRDTTIHRGVNNSEPPKLSDFEEILNSRTLA